MGVALAKPPSRSVLNGCSGRNLVDAVKDVQQVNDEQVNETTVEVGAFRCTILILESCLLSPIAI